MNKTDIRQHMNALPKSSFPPNPQDSLLTQASPNRDLYIKLEINIIHFYKERKITSEENKQMEDAMVCITSTAEEIAFFTFWMST